MTVGAAALAVVTFGGAAGYLLAQQRTIVTEDLALNGAHLGDVLRRTDVVISAAGVRATQDWVTDDLRYEAWALTIADVIFVSDVPQSAWHYPDEEAVALPKLVPGMEIAALESLGTAAANRQSVVADLNESAARGRISVDRYIVGLTWWDAARFPDRPAEWSVSFIGRIDKTAVAFAGRDSSLWKSDMDGVRNSGAIVSESSDVDLLVAWLTEVVESRATGSEGPIESAHYAALASPSFRQRWDATDPKDRPLDPELTPPDVLSELREMPLFVHVEESARRSDRYVIVRTASGVAHVAHLSGGTHPAPTFTAPGDAWEVWIASDAAGSDAWRIATIPSALVEESGALEIRIAPHLLDSKAARAAEGAPDGLIRSLTIADFDTVIDTWQAEKPAD